MKEHTRSFYSYPCWRRGDGDGDIDCFDFIFSPSTEPMKHHGLLVVVTIQAAADQTGSSIPTLMAQSVDVLDEFDRPVPWALWAPHSEEILAAIEKCLGVLA